MNPTLRKPTFQGLRCNHAQKDPTVIVLEFNYFSRHLACLLTLSAFCMKHFHKISLNQIVASRLTDHLQFVITEQFPRRQENLNKSTSAEQRNRILIGLPHVYRLLNLNIKLSKVGLFVETKGVNLGKQPYKHKIMSMLGQVYVSSSS